MIRGAVGFRRLAVGGGALLALLAAASRPATAQEPPYFITYTHHMEEPGSLELELAPVLATQRGGNSFAASSFELEYGLTAWWTTELYLAGQSTMHDGTVFTGWRWEHRVRLLAGEHPVNPVLYVEYEDLSGADKTILEVVGHDVEAGHAAPNPESRRTSEHELETKLILSGQARDWNLAGNLIAAKNLAGEPWEFGYALGVSRPLALAARPGPCTLCPENFSAGLELYGGLGDGHTFGLPETSHYLAPVIGWNLPSGWTFRLSPGFGLNRESHRFLLRLGVSYELPGFGRAPGGTRGSGAP